MDINRFIARLIVKCNKMFRIRQKISENLFSKSFRLYNHQNTFLLLFLFCYFILFQNLYCLRVNNLRIIDTIKITNIKCHDCYFT